MNHCYTKQEQLKKIKIAKDSSTLEISFLLPQFLRKLTSKSTYTNIFVCFNDIY